MFSLYRLTWWARNKKQRLFGPLHHKNLIISWQYVLYIIPKYDIRNDKKPGYFEQNIRETESITTLFNIQTPNEFFNTKNVEILNADSSEALSEYIKFDTQDGKLGSGLRYASPEVLLSLKKSHINFPIKFEKHMLKNTLN